MFEGLARAMPIDLGRFPDLLNANHLLYGPLGWVFHAALDALGLRQPAVHSLQALDALLGGAGLLVFAAILRRAGAEKAAIGAWTAALGACFGYWALSSEAENYIFSTLLVQVFFLQLLRYLQGEGPAYRLGLFHALAVGGHVVNAVLVLPAAWFILRRHGAAWRRPLLEYAGTAAAAVLLVYVGAWSLAVGPAGRYGLLEWLLGSAAGGARGAPSLEKLLQWLKTSGAAVACGGAPWLLWPARGLCAAILVSGARRLRSERTLAAGCLLWLAAYAAVFTTWEPHTLVYRVSDLPAFCLLLFLAAGRRARTGAALAALLGAGNFAGGILPRSREENNPHLARMDLIRRHTRPSDWIAAGGGRDELYLPYFAERRPLVYGRSGERETAERIRAIQRRGETVYATAAAAPDFAAWRPVPAVFDREEPVLYRLGARR